MTKLIANIVCGVVAVVLAIGTVLFVVYGPRPAAIATGLLSLLFAAMVFFSVRSEDE